MLWYCRYTWHPSTTAQAVRERVLAQHAAGTISKEKIKGWYNLVGGGAGFLLVETQNTRELNEMLQPTMDLVSWDVHGCYELPYEETITGLQQMAVANA